MANAQEILKHVNSPPSLTRDWEFKIIQEPDGRNWVRGYSDFYRQRLGIFPRVSLNPLSVHTTSQVTSKGMIKYSSIKSLESTILASVRKIYEAEKGLAIPPNFAILDGKAKVRKFVKEVKQLGQSLGFDNIFICDEGCTGSVFLRREDEDSIGIHYGMYTDTWSVSSLSVEGENNPLTSDYLTKIEAAIKTLM